jgi:hypothetical protein
MNGQEKQTLLDEGINAVQAALTVYSHENNPLNWAKAQQLLGTFLYSKQGHAEKASLIEMIKAAIDAFRASLEIYTKENNENDWARSEYELGMAITSLFDISQEEINSDSVVSALTALKSALEVYDIDKYPQGWALANFGIAYTYYLSARSLEDKNNQVAQLHVAYQILESVLNSHILNTAQENHALPTRLFQQIKNDLATLENT